VSLLNCFGSQHKSSGDLIRQLLFERFGGAVYTK
jgi:hypothetical protein